MKTVEWIEPYCYSKTKFSNILSFKVTTIKKKKSTLKSLYFAVLY